jgi:hypothetical protein
MKPGGADHPTTERELLEDVLLEVAQQDADPRHLTPEEILAYLRGALGEEAQGRTQSHLTACRECASALLDLEALTPSTPGAPEGAVDFEKAAAWHSMRAQLAERRIGASLRRARFAYATAAALFLCVVGLSLWTLRRPAEGPREPQIDVPLIYLDSATTRGGPATQPPLPPTAGFMVLVLTPSQSVAFPEYRVEIAREDGRLTWSGGGLHLSDYGALRLAVPSSLLSPGRYTVRLYGLRDKQSQALDSYALLVPKPKE